MNVLFWVSFGVLWFLVIIQGFAFLEMMRQLGQLRRQTEQQGALFMQGVVKEGASLPELAGLSAVDLSPVTRWKDYLTTDFSLVLLLSTHCMTCRTLAEDLTGFAADVRGEASLVVFVQGKVEDAQQFIAKARLDRRLVIIDENGHMAERFGVLWNPGVVTVRGGKLGGAAIVNTVEQLSPLITDQEEEHVMV